MTKTTTRGHLILGPTSTTWDPALRYFRLSQVTDDLFDAFRNLYLAMECVLDAICPRPKRTREGAWLRLALQRAAAMGVDLNKYARPGTGSAEDRLYKEIWTDVRNAVFHAKGSQARYLPLDASSRPAVQDALLRLGGLFMDLAGNQLGVRFLSSGMSLIAIAAMAESVVSDTQIVRSPSRATLDFAGNVHLPEGPMVSGNAHRAPELDDDRTRFVVASFAAAEVAGMPTVQTLVLMKDGAIHAFEEFEGSDLTLGDTDHFEVAFGVELGGVSLRSSYPS